MKYVCPKCQSQLKYWEEFIITKERKINKATGKINKKITTVGEVDAVTHGLTCTNEQCDFEYNGNFVANKEYHPQLDRIFENIS